MAGKKGVDPEDWWKMIEETGKTKGKKGKNKGDESGKGKGKERKGKEEGGKGYK